MENLLYIIWNDENNFRIPVIDEQHRGIVAAINTFHYFVQKGRGPETVTPALSILEQYSALHFETEEALMAQADYPGFEEHVLLHQDLMKKTKMISQKADPYGDVDVALRFLKAWWLGHINSEDRKYAPYIYIINKAG
jgi:hemerythrin